MGECVSRQLLRFPDDEGVEPASPEGSEEGRGGFPPVIAQAGGGVSGYLRDALADTLARLGGRG